MRKLNKILNILIGVVLLSYGCFFFWFKQSRRNSQEAVQRTDFSSQDVDKVANKYLKQTVDQMVIDRFESDKVINKALSQPVHITKPKEIDPLEIPAQQQIWKESDYQQTTPAEIVNSRVFEKEASEKQDIVDKKEYARQFIENARKGGYHVVLSDDLKVISVTPIRKPSQNDDSVETIPSY